VNALSQAISVLSQQLSVLSSQVSVMQAVSARNTAGTSVKGLQSILNAFSNRISAAGGGSGSVTSTEVSAVSAQAASALSQAISVGTATANDISNNLSNETSNRISADDALSNAISNLTSAHNALSNLVSGAGNLSNQVSILSQAVSVLSNNVSNLTSAKDVVSNAISVLSQQVSVLSQAVSVLSQQVSAAGGFQQAYFNAGLTISAATLVDITSLGFSTAAGGVYAVQAMLMWEAIVSGGYAFGLSMPALAAGGTYLHAFAMSAAAAQVMMAAGFPNGVVVMSAVAAGNTAVTSVSAITVNALRGFWMTGVIATSAGAAGSVHLMAKGSVAGSGLLIRSGFVKAYRIA
jgi:hypothetical protein